MGRSDRARGDEGPSQAPSQRTGAHPRSDQATARRTRAAAQRPTRRVAPACRRLASAHPSRSECPSDCRDGRHAAWPSLRPLSRNGTGRLKGQPGHTQEIGANLVAFVALTALGVPRPPRRRSCRSRRSRVRLLRRCAAARRSRRHRPSVLLCSHSSADLFLLSSLCWLLPARCRSPLCIWPRHKHL